MGSGEYIVYSGVFSESTLLSIWFLFKEKVIGPFDLRNRLFQFCF